MGLTRILATRLSKFIKRYITRPFKDPVKTQEDFFWQLIRRNQKTIFGKRHNFSQIHSIKQFQKSCPISKYEDYEPYIKQIRAGNPHVLTTANQTYWGQTPGTSGMPKLIPIVNHMFKSVNLSILRMIISYIVEDPRNNSRFLDGKSCFLAAYPLLRYEGKLPVGYGTGLFSYHRGGTQIWKIFTKSRIYIPIHLYKIKDIEKRYYQLTKEVIHKDFRQFTGVPSVVTNTFEKIIENSSKFGVPAHKIRDIFPDYHFSIFGGIPPKFYEKKLETLIGSRIDYREHYSATEGVLGIQMQETPGFTPMVDANFFEFIPVKNPDERCILNEVKKNEEYYLCITSYNGFYAYNLDDVIKFTSEDPPIFVFVSRKGVVNLVDEKVSHDDILYTIDHTNQQFNTVLTDFSVVGLRNPDLHYLFILEFAPNFQPTSYSDYLGALDSFLQEANEVYRYFRKDIGILKSPVLWILETGSFNEVLNERIRQGAPREQTKIPHLTDDPKIRNEFENTVKSEIKM
ncbi:MAG: GH3 auxin-responsive promoter family protein [Candidatus Helarchaeota archaeon]|nr:GH3 auxin-responsive promoter family protein [Candidatus Helarchaeota archaeon]